MSLNLFYKMRLVPIVLLVVALSSCEDKLDTRSYSVELQLQFPEEVSGISKAGREVMLFNQGKGIEITAISDANGMVRLDELEAGTYTISASISIKYLNKPRVLNGFINTDVVADYSDILPLKMADGGNFVISQFYYSGCLTTSGKLNYDDQFIEIFNNSDETLFADGLSIVEHEASGNNPSEWKEREATHIIVKSIWTIPGNGSEVPVLPGKSLVIASNGYDFKSDVNGNTNSPVNLGKSSFEYHLLTESGRDIDYPTVPNLIEDLFVLRGSVYYFHTRGGSAMALAWLPDDRQAFINNNLVPLVSLNTTRYYCKLPNEFVEDAVESVWNDRIYKRFYPSLDAGHVAVDAGSKSGLCIRRKVAEVVDGRNVLKDTNNSTEDFDHDVVPVPGYFELN